jgi:hypothetical protein
MLREEVDTLTRKLVREREEREQEWGSTPSKLQNTSWRGWFRGSASDTTPVKIDTTPIRDSGKGSNIIPLDSSLMSSDDVPVDFRSSSRLSLSPITYSDLELD